MVASYCSLDFFMSANCASSRVTCLGASAFGIGFGAGGKHGLLRRSDLAAQIALISARSSNCFTQLTDLCGQVGTLTRDLLLEAVKFSLVCGGQRSCQFGSMPRAFPSHRSPNPLNLRDGAHEHFFILSSHGFDIFRTLELLALELIGDIGALSVKLRQNLRLCGLANVELSDGVARAVLCLCDPFTRLSFRIFERAGSASAVALMDI